MEPMWLVLGVFIAVFGLYEIVTHYKKDVPDERVDNLQKKPSTKQGRFAANRESKAAEARTNATVQVTKETTAHLDLETATERHERTIEAERLLHENVVVVTSEATAQKVSPPAHDQIRIRQEESKVKVEEHRELAQIDLQRRWVEIEQDLKSGFIFAQKERQYLKLFQDYLFGLYEDRKRIESSNDLAKDDKLKFLNGHIKGMEKDFREQQKRLLQVATQKDLAAGDADTESSRDN